MYVGIDVQQRGHPRQVSREEVEVGEDDPQVGMALQDMAYLRVKLLLGGEGGIIAVEPAARPRHWWHQLLIPQPVWVGHVE